MPETPTAKPSLQLRVALRSDVGMRRANNQDSVAAAPHPNGEPVQGDVFLMVADGMGAHAAGELASKMATDSIPHAYLKCATEPAASALRRAIREANEAIHRKGESSPDFNGMGTTCSCLVATQGAVLVGHVGDSRVYRLRDGVLEQLTFDHSLVWEMAAASNVSADKVPSCIPKNVITRSLGPHETVNVDLEGPHPLAPGDVFLLCSDGLTGVVDDTLAGGVLAAMDPDRAVEALVNLANLRGGPDNISVVVARVESCDDPGGSLATAPLGRAAWGLPVGIAAACAIACGWFLMRGNNAGLVASAIGLGAAVAYGLAARHTPEGRPAGALRALGGAYGNGPYRRTECGDLAAAAGDLRDLVRELSSLDSEEDTVGPSDFAAAGGDAPPPTGFLIDWKPFRAGQEEADAAYERGDYPDAIRRYSRVVSDVMEAVRTDDDTHRYRSSRETAG